MASGSVTRRFLFSTSFLSLEHLRDTEDGEGPGQGHIIQGHSQTLCHHTASVPSWGQSRSSCELSPTCTGSQE